MKNIGQYLMETQVDKVAILSALPLLSMLSMHTLQALAQASRVLKISQGESLLQEEEAADGLYIVVEGSVAISYHAQKIQTLQRGDYFGELRALVHANRQVTAMAESNGSLLFISKQLVDDYAIDFPEELYRLNDHVDRVLILSRVALFAQLPSQALYVIANFASWKEVARGESLFKEGDLSDGVYVVASGVIVLNQENRVISRLMRNDYFGEIGALLGENRLASATADSDALLLYISNNHFFDITLEFPELLYRIIQRLITFLETQYQEFL
jgi:CRP-like cAMP-binding protein